MRKRLISNYILIILISIGITAASFLFYGYSYLVEQTKTDMISKVDVLANFFDEGDIKTEKDVAGFIYEYASQLNLRLTFIDEDGNVIADSEVYPVSMENHLERPEVKAAFRQRVGYDQRYSETMGADYYYAAVRVKTKYFYGVIRASEPSTAFQNLLDNLGNSVIVITFICIGFALIMVSYYSKRFMEPIEYMTMKAEEISNGEYNGNILVEGQDEVARLARSFNRMTKTLHIEQDRVVRRKEELNSILSSMNSGIAAIDSEGKILFYNEAFLDLIHYSTYTEESLLGKSFYEYLRNEDVIDVINHVEEEESPIKKETTFHFGEEKSSVLVKGTPLYKKSKRQFGTLLVLDDITRMKKLENVRRDFVSNVTHELKTPLTSIKGFVDTLKGGAIEDPEYAIRFLNIIDIEAERLSVLVNDILILSEIESGNDTGKSMVNVESVIDDVISLLEKKEKEGVVIVKDMPEPVTDYLCNRDRLKELIINLADNGIKYTNEGRVVIRCWEEEKDLMFQFVDTGVGIPREHLPRLFERFYRVDKGRSRKQGGTGLGLSIVKHIVELYKGDITVESEPGVGTTFTVRLPYY